MDLMRRMHSVAWGCRSGFTIIELLVVVSILALLVALMLPAVQSSREAARRVQCISNLRQLGISCNSYLSACNSFPTIVDTINPDIGNAGFRSAYVALLPFLDQKSLYNSINLDRPGVEYVIRAPEASVSRPHEANRTAAQARLATLLCPSDVSTVAGEWGGANYRVNCGTLVEPGGNRLAPAEVANGAFKHHKSLSPAEFSDGLANTAAFSEKPRGSHAATSFLERKGYWITTKLYNTQRHLLQLCNSSEGVNPRHYVNDVGNCWFLPFYRFTQYNHDAGPNSLIPDCVGGWSKPDPAYTNGLFSARSYHGDGVNVCFSDGHVVRASNTIGLEVWRALGTRNGAELVEAP